MEISFLSALNSEDKSNLDTEIEKQRSGNIMEAETKERSMQSRKKAVLKSAFMLAVGILMIVTVGIAYLPSALQNGMYEFELTFLSNLMLGVLYTCGGLRGIFKRKALPQQLYCNVLLLLQMVFLICMGFIGEFHFYGAYLFLHIVNPILATAVFFVCTSCSKMPGKKALASALLFPCVYLIYVIVYGYLSGYWLYGILNIPDRGILFVTILVAAVAAGTVLLELLEYKISFALSRRYSSDREETL
jgi:hypothetical protein